MPAGVAPAGSGVGEVASSVRLPPLTANVPTSPTRLSSTYRKRPSGLSRASTAPTPPVAATGVLPSRVSVPPGAIWEREISPGRSEFLPVGLRMRAASVAGRWQSLAAQQCLAGHTRLAPAPAAG